MGIQDNFIANVEGAMRRLGMTQRELAVKSGVHFVQLNRILKRTQSPMLDTCERLAVAVGIDPPKVFQKNSRKTVASN